MSDESSNSRDAASKTPAFLRDASFIALEGKKPINANWTTDLNVRLDLDAVQQRLAGGDNVGVVLGERDLVLDIDPRNFPADQDSWSKLKADLDTDFADFPTVKTGSGGWHIYMRLPSGAGRLKGDLGGDGYGGVELKFLGRQVVAPGSIHPVTGDRYVVVQDLDPLDEDLGTPEAPKALMKLAARPEASSDQVASGSKSADWLAKMLEHLDVEDYRNHEKWLELMMACHDATGGEGCGAFVGWSTSDPVYSDQDIIIARRWDSLDAAKGRRVTVRTLEKHLIDAGVIHLVEPDFEEAIDDFAAIDDLPDCMDEEAIPSAIDRVNSDRFTVLTGGKYLVGRERTDPRSGVFSVEWYSPDSIKQHMNALKVETPDGKQVPLGTWWTSHPQRRQYDGVIFDPTPGANHPELYNLWRGWAVDARQGDWSAMQSLIKEVLCRGDSASYDYVVRWMAHMVQHPSTPAEVALVFKGAKGTGKGTLCRALTDLGGKHGRHVTSSEHFTGRFNEHLADTIILFVDEGFWAGDKKAEGVLKGLITEKTMSFEGKGKPVVQGPNHLHVVMASNEDWVVPATHDERRFAVFETHGTAAKGFKHFGTLIEEGPKRTSLLAAMLYDLQRMDLGDWHPRKNIPQTDALVAQKVQGFAKDPVSSWWHRCLDSGTIFLGGDPLKGTANLWPTAFDVQSSEKTEMVDQLDAHALQMGRRAAHSKIALAKFLGLVGVDVHARDTRGGRVWHVPPLEEARKAFEAYVGGKLEWDGD